MQLRKLSTKEALERKKRRNQIITGTILLVIMVLSTAGYAMNREKQQSFSYKGFEFSRSDTGWEIVNQPFSLATRFLPQDVENVSLQGYWPLQTFSNKEIYFVAYSDEAKIVSSEIAKNLPFKRAQYACFENDSDLNACKDLPLKTCFDNVIFINYFQSKNETEQITPRVYQEDNCVVIEAEYKDLMRATDRFLFDVYDII